MKAGFGGVKSSSLAICSLQDITAMYRVLLRNLNYDSVRQGLLLAVPYSSNLKAYQRVGQVFKFEKVRWLQLPCKSMEPG